LPHGSFGKWNPGIGTILPGAVLDLYPVAVIIDILGLLGLGIAGYDLIYNWSERAELRRREVRVLRGREGRCYRMSTLPARGTLESAGRRSPSPASPLRRSWNRTAGSLRNSAEMGTRIVQCHDEPAVPVGVPAWLGASCRGPSTSGSAAARFSATVASVGPVISVTILNGSPPQW